MDRISLPSLKFKLSGPAFRRATRVVPRLIIVPSANVRGDFLFEEFLIRKEKLYVSKFIRKPDR